MKKNHFYLGVDGGASKTNVVMQDRDGQILGEAFAGPANIRISVNQAWQSIYAAINTLMQKVGLALDHPDHAFHVGMGLAGCEVQAAYRAFIETPHPFQSLFVTSDAEVACLGAHGGHDGAIVIVGTGVIGFKRVAQDATRVAGWGFPHDDEGGGAWLGMQAVKVTLQWLDRRMPPSTLAHAVYGHFERDQNKMVAWANAANSTAFAELAPLVIMAAETGDITARSLLQYAARFVEQVLKALALSHPENLTCSLLGGIAPFIKPYLNQVYQTELTDAKASPAVGAACYVRAHVAQLHQPLQVSKA